MASLPPTRVVRIGDRAAAIEFSKGLLRVVTGPDEGRETEVERSTVTIGTSPACDLTLTDTTVSRLHAEIDVGERGFCLRDLGSTNGTFLGSVRVGAIYLQPGTRFFVGQTEIEFIPTDEQVEILLSEKDHFGSVIGRSLKMREIFYLLEKFASKEVTVLLVGETGTGKGLLARSIHDESDRRGAPFVTVDCGAIPEDLIESELFGHKRGAFTGADEDRVGAFETAHRGTIFLDEVGELRPDHQPKLLRAIEDKRIRRVGENETRYADVRIIAATNRRLEEEVEAGRFRKDLFYRLSVVQIHVPPLRERRDDIPLLAEHFLEQVSKAENDPQVRIALDALSVLSGHNWPGNVRELRNTLERARVMSEGTIDAGTLLAGASQGFSERAEGIYQSGDLSYAEARGLFEQAYLTDVLRKNEGNVARAAEAAGIQRQSMYRLIKKHGIDPKNLT